MELKKIITVRENWPKPGISFKDITPLLNDYDTLEKVINVMTSQYMYSNVTKVLCPESRGFFFGTAVALGLRAGIVGARKPGKLPFVGYSAEYDLEYGKNVLEIAKDTIQRGDRVLIVDDLLATGGSALALTKLVKEIGATLVGYSFVIELTSLKAREKLGNVEVHSLVKYEI